MRHERRLGRQTTSPTRPRRRSPPSARSPGPPAGGTHGHRHRHQLRRRHRRRLRHRRPATNFTVVSATSDHRHLPGRARGHGRRHRHRRRSGRAPPPRPTSSPTRPPRRSPPSSPIAGPTDGRHHGHRHRHRLHRRERGRLRHDRGDQLHGRLGHLRSPPPPRPSPRARSTSPSPRRAGRVADLAGRPVHLRARADGHRREPGRPARRPAARTVTITGTDFTGATAVNFGTTAASRLHGRLGHPDHRHLAGRARGHRRRHRHHARSGRAPDRRPADQFTYEAAPTVTAVSPVRAGRGRHLGHHHRHRLHRRQRGRLRHDAATNFTVNSTTQITATSRPRPAGTVDVTVTTAGGTERHLLGRPVHLHEAHGRLGERRTPARPRAAPRSPSPAPTSPAPPRSTSARRPATSFTVDSDTQITATSPARTGGHCRRHRHHARAARSPVGPDQFTYEAAPTVSCGRPSSRAAAGGTSVTIAGTGFTAASAVDFGTTAATSFTVDSDTQITATSPAESAGAVDVTVDHGGRHLGDLPGRPVHLSMPSRRSASVVPNAGPPAAAPSVTITGTDFTAPPRSTSDDDGGRQLHRRLRHPDHRHLAGRLGGRGRRHRHQPERHLAGRRQ